VTKKIFTVIFTFTTLVTQAQQPSSETRVNETFRKSPLAKALKTIQKNYNVKFGYDNALVQNIIVSIDLNDLTIQQSIERLLQGTSLTFDHIGENYVIIPKPPEIRQAVERVNIAVSGSVVDADNGETLPQTSIRITGTHIGTASNNDGYFSLINIPNDTCSLEIMYIGYITQRIPVKSIDNTEHVVIRLRSDTRVLNEVLVLGEYNHAVHVEDFPGTFVFNPKSVANLPSLGEQDMSRTLQLLPGITATDESSSGMTIRGSHSSYNLTLLDGMTIYQQDHFFGSFSIINTDIIKDVRVHKGMFDARYGGRASGVVDITSKNGNSLKPAFNAKVNMMNLKASAEVPLGKKWSLFAAGRRSFTDVVQSELFTTLFDIASISNDQIRFLSYDVGQDLPSYYFADINSKLTFRPTTRDVISLSLYNSRDKMHNDDSLSFESGPEKYVDRREETTRWGNNGISLRWGRQWNERFYSNFRVSGSEFYRRYDYNSHTEIRNDTDSLIVLYQLDFKNSIADISYAINNEWSLNNKLSIDFGVEGTRQNMHARVTDAYKVSGNAPPEDETDDVNATETSQSWLNSFYVSTTFSPVNRLSTTLGARAVHYYNKDGRLYLEPRVSALYRIHGQVNLKAAYGRSNQFITQQFNYSEKGAMSGLAENFWILADPGDIRYPVTSSDHVTAGATWRTKQYVVDAEGYYKFSRGVIIDDNFNSATTVAYGLDLMIQKISGIHTGWIAYSLGHGTQTHPYILNGRSAPSWQDQRHELKVVNMLTLGNWSLSSTVIYGSGKPFPKYNVRYLRDQNGFITQGVPVLDYSNTSRLPSYFSLNIAVSYKLVIGKKQELELGLSIHNITDHKNVKTRRIDKDRFDEAILTNTELPASYKDITLLGFSPSLFLSFSF
jgi:ferric enterobactin receptor